MHQYSFLRIVSLFSRVIGSVLLLSLLSVAHAALELEGEINPNPVRPGELVRGEFTVSNTGVGAETGVTLAMLIPAGVDFFYDGGTESAAVIGGGECVSTTCDPGEEVVWTLGTLAAGEVRSVAFWTTVANATVDATVLSFDAAVFDGDTNQDDSLSVLATVETGPVLTLAVEDDADPVVPGGSLVYNVTFGNPGVLAISGATLTLPLPAEVSFVSATGGGIENAGTVTWALGTLTPGQSGEFQAEVTASNGLVAGDVLKVAAATVAGSTVEAVPVAVQAEAQALTQVAASAPLQLMMEVNPDPVRVDERILVNLTATNTSGAALSGVTLTTRVPEVDFFFDSPSEGADVWGAGTCPSTTCDQKEPVTWAIGDLAAGEAVTVGYWSTVDTLSDGELLELDAWVIDAVGNEAIASQAVAVYDLQPLALAIEDNTDPVAAGDTVVYTLTYSNLGLLAVSGTSIKLPLPAGTTLVAAFDGGIESGGVVTWSLGTLAPGDAGELRLEVDVTGLVAGQVVQLDAAELSGATVEATPRQVRALAQSTTQVAANLPLALQIAVNPNPVRSDEQVRTDLTVTNQGGATLFGAELQVRVADGLDFFVDSPNEAKDLTGAGTCSSTTCDVGELVTWALGDLPVGASTTVSFWTDVATVGTGELLRVDARVTDTGGNEALDSRTVVVDNEHQLALAIDTDADPVLAGDTLIYTLTYGNFGLTSATGAVLSLPLPEGVNFVSATGGGFETAGTVTWNLGTLLAGDSGQVRVATTVDGGVASGALLEVDLAQLTASAGNAIAQHVVRVGSSGLALVIEANPDPVRADELLRTEIAVTNESGFTLFNVQVQTRVPRGLDFFVDAPSESADVIGSGTCSSTTCDQTELVTWALGNLPAGGSTTLAFWTDTDAALEDGELIILDARATADAGNETLAGAAVPIASGTALTLAIDESADSVANGDTLEYTLAFGNRSIATVADVTIELPVPDGLAVVGATFGNPDVNAERILWNIGDLSAGEGGLVKAQFTVDAVSGDQILAQPVIAGVDAAERATAITRVTAGRSLDVEVDILAPNQPDDAVTVNFEVINTTAFTLFGVNLQTRIPEEFDFFGEVAGVVGGGTCASTTCDPGEILTWALGNLAAGQTVNVSYETDVQSGLTNGRLITVDAYAREDAGSQTTDAETVLIGPDSDADQDGISDTYEQANGLDRNDPADAIGDEDSDGLLNVDEFLLGTGLNDPDSDSDSVLDGADNCALDSNPGQADNDADSLGDACDVDDDNDGILDVDDNCQFVVNNNQADGDGDGLGNACEPPPLADLTEAGDTSGDGDLAVLLQGDATGSQVQVFDAASGALLNTIDFFSWAWEPIAIDTISDSDGNGTADDPAIAMVARRPDNGQVNVQLRRVSDGSVLRSNIGFFSSRRWIPNDVAVLNDTNGDGTPGDVSIAVLAKNIDTGRNEVEVLPLSAMSGDAPSFKSRYFNPDWNPVALEAYVPAGGGDTLIGVLAENQLTNKTVFQRRRLSDGVRITNIFAFGTGISPSDVAVTDDGDANGTGGDPALVFYGTNLTNGNAIVRIRSDSTGAKLDEYRILGNVFTPERAAMFPDASGDNVDDVSGSARRISDGALLLKQRNYDTSGNISDIFPTE